MRLLKLYLGSLWNFLFPPYCCACSSALVPGESFLCTLCFLELPRTYYHKHQWNPVMRSFYGRVPIERAAAWLHFSKGGIVQSLMHQFKYKDRPDLALFLGKQAALDCRDSNFFDGIDLVIPVPLHPKKERKRTYNQAALIAEGMAEVLGLEMQANFLRRRLYQNSQTREHRFERWLNVSSAFEMNPKIRHKAHHILLVDDVITTGATLEACVQSLLQVQGLKISVFSLAHA